MDKIISNFSAHCLVISGHKIAEQVVCALCIRALVVSLRLKQNSLIKKVISRGLKKKEIGKIFNKVYVHALYNKKV